MTAIQDMKAGKAPRPDYGLLIELFKTDLNKGARQLHPVIVAFWEFAPGAKILKPSRAKYFILVIKNFWDHK